MKIKHDISEMLVFENEDYIVINKPAFVSTLEDRNDDDNILSLFREKFEDIRVCHRLDKETSGALLLAKNEEAYKHAALQFEHREVEKVYHALVAGKFTDETVKVEVPLRIAGSGRVKVDGRKGKEASTLFRPKQYFNHYTLIEAKPISGKRHQIRVHLSYLNYPIAGDEYYGGEYVFLSHFKKKYKPSKDKEERPIFSRVALHAYSIRFKGVDENWIEVACDYPKDIEMVLNKLLKYD